MGPTLRLRRTSTYPKYISLKMTREILKSGFGLGFLEPMATGWTWSVKQIPTWFKTALMVLKLCCGRSSRIFARRPIYSFLVSKNSAWLHSLEYAAGEIMCTACCKVDTPRKLAKPSDPHAWLVQVWKRAWLDPYFPHFLAIVSYQRR